MMKKIPFFPQMDAKDCGPACLRMIAKYYGKEYSMAYLREICHLQREGVSMLGISEAAEKIGFTTMGVHTDFERLKKATLPCIVHWDQQHFVVVCNISGKKEIVEVADPAFQCITCHKEEFLQHWTSSQNGAGKEGIALLLTPKPEFYEREGQAEEKKDYRHLFQYLRPFRKLIGQIFIGLAVGTGIGLIIPFLTQSMVDYGISSQNLHFVTMVLIAQLFLYLGQIGIEFIRSWILLHITARLNISIIADFLAKLMHLPIGFFDTKLTGDLMQRIGDHRRIESFLASSSLSTLFSMFSLFAFSIVLAYYNLQLLLIFLSASVCYAGWIAAFLKKRRMIDQKRFVQSAKEQSNLIQIITGIQEIKLNNCEQQKRWEWEHIQTKLFQINMKGLGLSQIQQSGAFLINTLKDLLITFLSAKAVIEGRMSLGMMMAVQSIIGEMNAPIYQLIAFIQQAQDAKISWERLNEIHQKKDEELNDQRLYQLIPMEKEILIENLSFQYNPFSPPVLKEISLHIPHGKTCAIVGMSGSGKTTLIKLLLGFYPPSEGCIKIGGIRLENLHPRSWRNCCGTVMQEGFIFSDSIAHNIAIGEETIDKNRLVYASKVANIQEMIESMPLGYNTLIGQEGNGISQGQKQRILIARAVYKNPDFLFFDEATNALDANNERIVMQHLRQFFSGKTVLISAHRLSTVRNADMIVVLHQGRLVESGTHEQLVQQQGHYYQLVKNQLEMGG